MINVLIMINMINHDQNRDLYQYGDHDQNVDHQHHVDQHHHDNRDQIMIKMMIIGG